ncbi:hypothetical protein HYD60_00845 [Mycoplasmopsis bovis]|nr:hypothetical protein [Mycoplasmopsis bovis]QQH60728.1 hypothetical protein HYD60_00845 [Mycoplasmopsis bovis]
MGLKKLWVYYNEFGSLEAIYENIGKISGKTKEYLENDYESAHFCKKLAILNPRWLRWTLSIVQLIKIVLNRNEAEEILNWVLGFYNVLDTYNLIR